MMRLGRQPLDLTGRVAVVTGAGSGIGAALSLRLAAAGAAVAVVDRDGPAAKATADRITAGRGRAADFELDVTDAEAVRKLPDEVAARLGPAAVLVNNAGVMIRAENFVDVSLDDAEWLQEINYTAVVRCTHAFLPQLLAQPEAALVNLSSLAGILGLMYSAPYVASKFAVRGFSEALRMELLKTPVSVTVVYPGAVSTRIVQHCRGYSDDEKEESVRRQAKIRPITADDAARAIFEGVVNRRARVLVGRGTRPMDIIIRALPATHTRLLYAPVKKMLDTVSVARH